MAELFLKIFNMSVSASWLVLAVLVLRFFMKKPPKWINVLLWGIVALRLVFPFSVESVMSLVPSAETIPPEVLYENSFTVQTGLPTVDNRVNEYLGESYYEGVTVPANNGFDIMSTLGTVWALGALALLIYTAISYFNLKRKVGTAVLLRGNIYQSENVASPFVLGIISPKIYLPFNMEETTLDYVVAHENAHIRRKDHWYKPFGFLLLAIHWFNPIMWVAYVTLCKDIELACDEKVISELGTSQRADYSEALLSCSVNRKLIAACPIAFGEVGVKERVKSVLNYKKPAFWVIVVAVVICAVVAICFLTDPKEEEETGENLLTVEDFEIFKGNDGKKGIKNSDGETVIEPIYDEIEGNTFYFVLTKNVGTAEEPEKEILLYSTSGNFAQGGPFDGYLFWDWTVKDTDTTYFGVPNNPYKIEKGEISLSKDYSVYSCVYEDGDFTLEILHEAKDPEKTVFGYGIFSRYAVGHGEWWGIKNSAGEIVIPCEYIAVDIPFEGRAYCQKGGNQTISESQALVFDLETGETLCESYNYMRIFDFDEGYFGVAFAEKEAWREVSVYLPDGTPTPYGWCFVDRNGNPVSEELYERIYTEETEWLWYDTEISSVKTKVYAQKFDGTVDEFTAEELLVGSPTYEGPLVGFEIFKKAGKYGIKNPDGEVVVEAEYSSIENNYDCFILVNSDGNYEAPTLNENSNSYHYGVLKKLNYEVFFRSGDMLPGGPYQCVEVRDIGDEETLIIATKDKNLYEYSYVDGKFTQTYFSEAEEVYEKLGTYTVFSEHHWNSSFKGLKNSAGKVIIPPVSFRIERPLEDIVVGLQGMPIALDCQRAFIYSLPEGQLQDSSFNSVVLKAFGESYIGIGISAGAQSDLPPLMDNGQVRPAGAWFINKYGQTMSKQYEYISTNKEDRWSCYIDSLNTVLYCGNFDGTVDEYTVMEIIENGGAPKNGGVKFPDVIADGLTYNEIDKNSKIEVSASQLTEVIASSVFSPEGFEMDQEAMQHFILIMSYSGREGTVHDDFGNPYDKSKLLYTNWVREIDKPNKYELYFDVKTCEKIAFEVFGTENFRIKNGYLGFTLNEATGEYYTPGGFSPSYTYASYNRKIAYIDKNTLAVRFVISDYGVHMGESGWKYLGEAKLIFKIMENEEGKPFLRYKAMEYYPFDKPISAS